MSTRIERGIEMKLTGTVQNGNTNDDFHLSASLEDGLLNLNYFFLKDGTEEFWMEKGESTIKLNPTKEEKQQIRKLVFGEKKSN